MLVDVNTDQLATALTLVVEVVNYRTNAEQRDLLDLAAKLDGKCNRHTTSNPRWCAFEQEGGEWAEATFEADIDASRMLDEAAGDRRVPPSWERKPAAATKRRKVRDREVAEVLERRQTRRGSPGQEGTNG